LFFFFFLVFVIICLFATSSGELKIFKVNYTYTASQKVDVVASKSQRRA